MDFFYISSPLLAHHLLFGEIYHTKASGNRLLHLRQWCLRWRRGTSDGGCGASQRIIYFVFVFVAPKVHISIFFYFLRNVPPHAVLNLMAMRAEIRKWRAKWARQMAAWARLALAATATICYVAIPLSRKCCTCQHRRQRNAPHASATAVLAQVVAVPVAAMNPAYCIK